MEEEIPARNNQNDEIEYVETKEEIFLEIYLENQEIVINEIMKQLDGQAISIELVSKTIANVFKQHLEYIKYHQIKFC